MSKKIMLDAGHYGKYNRAPFYKTYYESERMWKLHRYLQSELELRGYEVGTTRNRQDTDLAVFDRGQKAKGHDLFISLHSNGYDYADEAEARATDRVSVYAPVDIKNAAHKLAASVADVVADTIGIKDRSVKIRESMINRGYDYYGVMRGAFLAGCRQYILIEHGFHTNPMTAKWLMSNSNLAELAAGEAAAIDAYLSGKSSTTAKNNPYAEPKTTMKNGDRGDGVKWLQFELNAQGYGLTVDGIFGAATESAVRNYQASENLVVDGLAGAKTRAALKSD